jgi:hypothetical protein
MWIALGAVGLVLVGLLVWLGCEILIARNELARAQDAVAALRTDGDVGESLHTLAESGAAASSAASTPVWGWAEHVPIAGDNLRAVRLAAQSLDELSNGVVLPVMDGMKSDGGSLSALIRPLQTAGPKVEALSAELAALPTGSLIPQVRDGVAQVTSVMKLATPAIKYVPGLLGADGPRTYLVVAQNNAELVALGGSAASITMIRLDAGKPTIVRQASSQEFDYVTPLSEKLPKSLLKLYGQVMARHPNATVSRPDWPTAAGLMQKLWNRDITRDHIDGVASIDPIALSYILNATGPVTMSTGDELTSADLVKVALSDSYARYGDSGDHGDTFFKEIAAAVFGRVAGGDFDPKVMLQAIQQGIHNRSLMFWSADEEVQQFVASTRLGGVLPRTNKTATSIGVFFRDHSFGTKIDYYLQPSTTVTTECRADGTTAYNITVAVKLDISKQAEAKLPDYVRAHLPGQRYDTEVFVYGPRTGFIESHSEKRADYNLQAKDLGRWVAKFTISTTPGQTGSVTVTYTVPPTAGTLGPTQVLATPTVRPMKLSLDGQPCQLPR